MNTNTRRLAGEGQAAMTAPTKGHTPGPSCAEILAANGIADYDRDPSRIAQEMGLHYDGHDWPQFLHDAEAAREREQMENKLHINRCGWWVERPYATGSDIGPARSMRGNVPMDAEMLRELNDTILPYYQRAGFRIHDTRVKA